MPIRMPEVNGTAASPAAAIAASRTRRRLVGRAEMRPAARDSRSAALSSMMPCDTETARSRSISSRLMTPGLRCGSSPVSFSTSAAISAR